MLKANSATLCMPLIIFISDPYSSKNPPLYDYLWRMLNIYQVHTFYIYYYLVAQNNGSKLFEYICNN